MKILLIMLVICWILILLSIFGCATRVPPSYCREYVNKALDIRLCPYHADCHLTAEQLSWLRSYQQECEP